MKNLLLLFAIFSMMVFSSCKKGSLLEEQTENTPKPTQRDHIDLKEVDWGFLFTQSTQLNRAQWGTQAFSEDFNKLISDRIQQYDSIFTEANIVTPYSISIKLGFGPNGFLTINWEAEPLNPNYSLSPSSRACGDYDRCKTCRNEECVGSFLQEGMDLCDGCIEAKIEKVLLGAKVYTRCCE